MSINSIRVVVKHNDWTAKTDFVNIKLKHINFKLMNLHGNIYSNTLLYIKGRENEKKKFIKILKSSSGELKLNNIKFYQDYLEFITPINDSIYSYITSFRPLYCTCYVYYGIEDWIITYENIDNIVKELRQDINSSGEIVKMENVVPNSMFIPMDFLYSKSEANILNYAIYHGFFENPKKIRLHEISENFGISGAYASKILRSSLNKLMYSVF